MRLSSSVRHVVVLAGFPLLLPTCLLVDLNGLSGSGTSSGDGGGGGSEGGGVEGGGSEGGEAGDAQDAPRDTTSDSTGNGDVGADVTTDVVGGGDGEAGTLSYAETVLSDGPIAYWRLDDTTTATAKDSSGNGYDGTYQGNVVLGVQGAIANDTDTAVQFDGSSAEMVANVPGSFEFAGNLPYSIEVWAMPTASPGGMGIVGKSAYTSGTGYSGWYVAYNSSGYLDNWRNNDETGNPGPAPGAFIHVVATYDGTTLALYVNGQPFSTSASAAALPTTGAPLTAGSVANWGMFTGVLDEIAIYDKVLPAARIAAHYARGIGQ